MLKAYYYLTKPGIIYGNLLSTSAGFFLASRGHIDLWLLLAVLAGTALGIGSGCVLNNYIDRDIDKKMARTKKRALASGTISGPSALLFATILGFLGFLILILFTNMLVVLAGLIGVIFYVILYGAAKRRSTLGTVVGTIPGAMPLVAGYLAVTNRVDSGALLLLLIMALWQLPHFYAIAIFRLKDYVAANLPVMPVKRGIKTTKRYILWCIVGYAAAIPLLTIFGHTGYTYLLVMTGISLVWLWKGWQGLQDVEDTAWARHMFKFSLIVLLTFCTMLVANSWLP